MRKPISSKERKEIMRICYPQEPGTAKADGYPGHHIKAYKCLFHLHHHVLSYENKMYRVSTVGEMQSDFQDLAVENVGSGRLFETYVFEEGKDGIPIDWLEIDVLPANDSLTATENHYKLVEKYRTKGA